MDTNKVWYITGASKGLRWPLVKQHLYKGYKVAGTTKLVNALKDIIGYEETFLPLTVDSKSNELVVSSLVNLIESTLWLTTPGRYGLGSGRTYDRRNNESFEVNFFADTQFRRKF